MMNPLEEIARSALAGDALITRSLVQDWLASKPAIGIIPRPQTEDPTIVAIAAALAELFSSRLGQVAPHWAASIGPAPQPTHLLRSAAKMKHLREMCEAEAPLPLRHRQIFAPANYLEME